MSSSTRPQSLPPVVSGAVAYLRDGLKKNAWSETGRLPSIQALATAAGVSLVTMWKAVRALRDCGELTVVHGQGIHIPGHSATTPADHFPSATPAASRIKWHSIRQRIEADLLNGRFGGSTVIPSLKELGHTYGTSFQTLKQALKALEINGMLRPHGRTYAVSTVSVRRSDAYVIAIGRGDSSENASQWTPWAQEWQRLLERECATARIGLDTCLYTTRAGRLVFLDQDTGLERTFRAGPPCLGVLLRSIGQDDLHLQVLHAIARERVFVAVSDEGTCEALPAPFARNARMRVFAVSNGLIAGRTAARFLLEHGHRRAAYISPFDTMRWSRDRLLGMREVFSAAGAGDIPAFTRDDIAFPFERTRSRAQAQISARAASDALRNADCPPQRLQILRGTVGEAIERALEEDALREILRTLFEQALATGVPAWVCANDRVALAAIEFLGRKNATKQVTVTGFDDTFDAFRHRFSSYNFNITALVNAMFTFVVAPHMRLPARRSDAVVNIEGYMVTRGP